MSDKIVFISHSTEDDQIANGIRQALEHLRIEAWTDSQRLVAGDQLTPEIEAAIRRASHVIAVLSLNAINSAWVSKEIKFALGLKKKVIPVLLPGIEQAALTLWFGEEPVGLKLAIGPGGVSAALPRLLAALGEQLPGEKAEALQAHLAPLADLILTLGNPAITAERATASASLTYYPPGGSSKVEGWSFRFTAPIGPLEADDLAWYFERYVNWPTGVFQKRARSVEGSLPKWGRLLYDTLNVEAGRAALEAWKAAPQEAERRFTVKVHEKLEDGSAADAAATALLSLPWELIHDEQGFLFQGARGVRVRRSLPNRKLQPALATEPPIRVLLVSPRPEDQSAAYIDHRASARPLAEALSKLGDLAEFTLLTPATFGALEKELMRKHYHVVHFDGHGLQGALCFEEPADSDKIEKRRTKLVKADELAQVLRDHRVPLFFLDACQSASGAGPLLKQGVASVAAMSHTVLVETARRFAEAFYPELMAGKRVSQAMLAGQRALKMDTFRGKLFTGDLHLEDWFVPVLFQEEEQDPQLIREVPSEQVQDVIAQQRELALGDIIKHLPKYGFIGRSRELLKAERLLAMERYVVLQGGGGEGKTTLGAELAHWLVFTRRFAQGAFVRLDEDGDRRKVLFAIGRQLMGNFHLRAAGDDDVARKLVERALAEEPAVIVLDNMESVLAPAPDSEAYLAFEPETLAGILELCRGLGRIGETRLIFTSREALPAPFEGNVQRIGRLDRADAIRLVGRVLGEGKRMPHSIDEAGSEEEIGKLVDAVGCHARAVTLLAGEVAASGVAHATEKIHELMASLEKQHPGKRERSLLASVELSLRRLPAETRRKMRPLGVFQGGGNIAAIAMALGLDTTKDEQIALMGELVGIGLAEELGFRYFRFDPALAPALLAEMTSEECDDARARWAEAMANVVDFLYEQFFKNATMALNLALLELPNVLATLEYLLKKAAPERVVALTMGVEELMGRQGRPKALARVVEIRTEAARQLSVWSGARFYAETTALERLIDQGRYPEAVRAATSTLEQAQAAGEDAYAGAAEDLAAVYYAMGRALASSGSAGEALPHLDEAGRRFQVLGATRSVSVVLVKKADCLRDLGRYEEAETAYEDAIRKGEGDPRHLATIQRQLATLRLHQRRYQEALDLYEEGRGIFERLGEPQSVAGIWHQIGTVHQRAGQYELAERAYQESLKIKVQIGNSPGEAMTLNALGALYSKIERFTDAVHFYRKAVAVHVQTGDLSSEGYARNNLGETLVELKCYDEARAELLRAIDCKRPFGHAAKPWTTFAILSDLEQAVGNEPEARKAWNQAVEAYLAYRRQGGASQAPSEQLCALVARDPNSARRLIAGLRQEPNVPDFVMKLFTALEAVLAGSRDPAVADDPILRYRDAAELLLLMEKLG